MIPKTIKNIIFVLSPLLLQNHSCRNLVAISPTLNRQVWNCNNVSIFNQVSPNVKHRCVSRPHEQFNLEDDSAAAAAAWFSIQPGAGGEVLYMCYFLSVRQCFGPLGILCSLHFVVFVGVGHLCCCSFWFSIQPGGAGGVCYFLSVRQCCCPLVFCMLWYLWLLVIYDKTFSHRLLI